MLNSLTAYLESFSDLRSSACIVFGSMQCDFFSVRWPHREPLLCLGNNFSCVSIFPARSGKLRIVLVCFRNLPQWSVFASPIGDQHVHVQQFMSLTDGWCTTAQHTRPHWD